MQKGYIRTSKARKKEVNEKNRKAKGRKIGKQREKRDCAATLSDLYPSTCLPWEAPTGV